MSLEEAKFFAHSDLSSTMSVGQECAAFLLDSGECSIAGVNDEGVLVELGTWAGIRNLRTKGVNTCLAFAGIQESNFHFLTHVSGVERLNPLLVWLRSQYKARLRGQIGAHLCTPSQDLWRPSIEVIQADADFAVQKHFRNYMEIALRVPPPDTLFQVVCVGKDHVFFDD